MPLPTVQLGKTYIMNGIGRVTVRRLNSRWVDFYYAISLRHERMPRGKFRGLIVSEYVPPVFG